MARDAARDRGVDRPEERRGVEEDRRATAREIGLPAGIAPANAGEHAKSERSDTDPDDRKSPLPSIADLLKEGQEIIVQIAKEPLGQKGARITSHIALPGRYVVYMPTVEHLGVSRKIAQRRRASCA